MRFIIYLLNGCQLCDERAELHNELANMLQSIGVETVGVIYGNVSGENYYPLDEHDGLCRKEGDPYKYAAPSYILEVGDVTLKLPDVGNYDTPHSYVNYISHVLQRL